MARAARERRVYFVEDPIADDGTPRLEATATPEGVIVLVPHLPAGTARELAESWQRRLLRRFVEAERQEDAVHWYTSARAFGIAEGLPARAVVYDCAGDAHADDATMLARADLVFTTGEARREALRDRHPDVHAFPSCVDLAHFAQARSWIAEPADQVFIPHPRVGYVGVVDDRLDLELLAAVADRRPDLHLVMLGPVVKIEPTSLPQRPNLHWLGGKPYDALPGYLAGWKVAILPLARTADAELRCPARTPEYLAAGRAVVSTSMRDVQPYAERELVRVADEPEAFASAIDAARTEACATRRARADAFLAEQSWDRTWAEMAARIDALDDRARARL